MSNPWFQEQYVKLELAKEELLNTGLFKEIWRLDGWGPVQCEGRLSNGNWFYFRSRGDTASLEIGKEPWIEPYLARFEEVVTPQDKYAASYLEADIVKNLILRWLRSYLQLSPSLDGEPPRIA
jgi:hypothetical protein